MSKLTFPHFGDYCVPIEYLITRALDMEYVVPPTMTKHTLEIGSKYSPDYVCAPFKLHLGCFIEAIEAGADTLIQVGGACRLGYYGELHEQILKDLGYDITFLNLARANYSKPKTFYDEFKKLKADLNLSKVTPVFLTALEMVKAMDEMDDYVRQNIGFERNKGDFNDCHNDFLTALKLADSRKEVQYLAKNFRKRVESIPTDKPSKPLRVGIVGEYYSIMDGFSNHFIEIELAQKGIVVERWMNITNSFFHMKEEKMLPKIRGYSKYNMGATAMGTIERSLSFAKKGYDGIIHLKSFGCTPEMDAMPVLQNISADYKIPILYFSFDSQTSDTGIQTRLEAFYDMITMRKEGTA